MARPTSSSRTSTPAEAAKGCDVALLALPHKVTAAKVPELIAAGVKIVDMSGDFRLRDAAAYEKYYGAKHPHPELLGTFVYGLPELNREEIKAAKYVASPGCFATTIELALLPLARAGLLDGAVVHVTGITGSSGSGIAPQAGTHHPSRAGNLKTYKPLEHQHVPEIVQTLGDAGAKDVELRFVPVSAPLTRGIFATCFVELPSRGRQGEARRAVRRDATRASRSCAGPKQAAARGRRGRRLELRRGRLRGRRRRTTASARSRCFSRDRQPDQGRRRPGDPEHEPRARLRREGEPRGRRELAVSIVVKIGGEVIGSGEAAAARARTSRMLVDEGARVAIVHGGGPQATELQKQLGIETKQVAGRRVTDAATLDVMKMVARRQAQRRSVRGARRRRASPPVGLHGASGHVVRATRRPPKVYAGAGPDPVDMGFVGDVIGFNLALLETLWAAKLRAR